MTRSDWEKGSRHTQCKGCARLLLHDSHGLAHVHGLRADRRQLACLLRRCGARLRQLSLQRRCRRGDADLLAAQHIAFSQRLSMYYDPARGNAEHSARHRYDPFLDKVAMLWA